MAGVGRSSSHHYRVAGSFHSHVKFYSYVVFDLDCCGIGYSFTNHGPHSLGDSSSRMFGLCSATVVQLLALQPMCLYQQTIDGDRVGS